MEVDDVAQKILEYFQKMSGPPDTEFHVCGYKNDGKQRVQHIWRVSVAAGTKQLINSPGTAGSQGAVWGGESDIIYRLIMPVYAKTDKGDYTPLEDPDIAFQYFTLQDAIDFAVYGIRATADTIRFLASRAKTISAAIDVLVIKPHEAFWVSRKELHVRKGPN